MSRYTRFRPRLRSRHPSHSVLRPVHKNLPLLPFKSVIRFGSSTEMRDTHSLGGNRVEINTVASIKNSANKLKMKKCFDTGDVCTPSWFTYDESYLIPESFYNEVEDIHVDLENLPYPIISKHIFGSRGTGNRKHDTAESLSDWLHGKTLSNYIFERFHNYVREYRLHVSEDGCFYTCRKMLKRDTPEEARWYRNDDHCVWILEDNESFDKPSNWVDIVEHSVRALKSVGLDVGAVDVKVQSATKQDGEVRETPEFIIIEINSAPSFGELTAQKYIEVLPTLLTNKHERING